MKILFLLFIIFTTCYFGFYRNTKVRAYKLELNEKCSKICISNLSNEHYYQLEKLWDEIANISYIKMLFQFWKPLKNEYWLTKEQIDFLNLKFKNNEVIH